MTTTTKNLSNQESNYIVLEKPLLDLEKVIDEYNVKVENSPEFKNIESAFAEVKRIVFPIK